MRLLGSSTLRRGGLLLAAEGLSRLVGFATIPIAALFLGDRQLGELAIGLLVFSLMVAVFDFGLPAAATKLHFDSTDVHSLWWLSFSVTGGVLFAALLIGPLLVRATFHDISFYPLVLLAILAAGAGNTVSFGQARYRARFQVSRFSVLTVLRALFQVGPGLAGLAVMGTASGYLAGLASGLGLLSIGVLWILRREIGRPSMGMWPQALRFGLPLMPHLLFGWGLTVADRVLLERWNGLETVGRYALAYQISWVLAAVALALNNLWAPTLFERATKGGAGAADDLVRRVLAPVFALGLLGAAIVASAAPYLFRVLRPAGLMPWQVILLVSASSVSYLIYLLGVNPVFVRGATKVVPVATFVGVVVNLGLDVVLIPRQGVVGAAIGTFAGYFATSVAIAYLAARAGGDAGLGRSLVGANLLIAPIAAVAVFCSVSLAYATFWLAAVMAVLVVARGSILRRWRAARASQRAEETAETAEG